MRQKDSHRVMAVFLSHHQKNLLIHFLINTVRQVFA